MLVVGVVVAVFLVVVTLAQLSGTDEPGPAATDQRTEQTGTTSTYRDSGFVRRDASDPMAVGDPDAPVVMSMWTDFRCPFCAVFNRDTLPDVLEEYVDSGKVRVEVHDVAFFGKHSEAASAASRAAGQQGKFFEYMQAVYADAPEKGHPDMPRKVLVDFARQAGVPDVDAFTAALDDPTLTEQTRTQTRIAQQAGVSGVPFFVAGDQALSGAQPIEVFRQFLDDAVASAA